ncbi:MAG TPA: hypothetical protein PLT75_11645 [Spirochaetota bacterium]|nr:hypothetical protein [Spirochaetota bacterium]
MKKRIYVLILLCVAVSCASLQSYIDKRPQVRIRDFDIKSISFRDIDLLFDMEISNPYPIGLKLEQVKFRVDIEKNKLFETTTTKGFRIRAAGTESTPLVVNLEYSRIAAIVRDYRNKEYLTCDISGELVIPLPKIPGLPKTYTYPFKVTRKIPAIKPHISIANFRVKAPSMADIQSAIRNSAKNLNPQTVVDFFGRMIKGQSVRPAEIGLDQLDLKLDVNFDIIVKNETRAKLAFEKLSYNFLINNENVFGGNTANTRSVGNTLIVSVANQLSSKSLGKGVLEIFRERKGRFNLKGETFLQLPASIRSEPLKLEINENGNFGL